MFPALRQGGTNRQRRFAVHKIGIQCGAKMGGTFTAMGHRYRWLLVNETGAYPALTRALGFPQLVDVLRIVSDDSDFDVVMRVDGTAYVGGGSIRLGPVLCIGDVTVLARPSKWPTDALLRLRPRIAHVREGTPFGVAAERVVQWCTSRAFKAVRVKPTECLWVDYE